MHIARFEHEGSPTFGILDPASNEFEILVGDPMFGGIQRAGQRVDATGLKLFAPVVPRSKIIAIGRNYAAHAEELGNEVPDEPMMFLKPNTSVIGPGDPIVLPPQSSRVDHEAELCVVIGSIAKNVKAEDASQVIFGYTVGNDVTARDLQRSDGQWSRAKGFDTFAPLGPVIATAFDTSDARIAAYVDGELRQEGTTADLIHPVSALVEYASSVFTLLPGDVIMTGTPAGVGPIEDGQTVSIEIDGIGTLSNPVIRR